MPPYWYKLAMHTPDLAMENNNTTFILQNNTAKLRPPTMFLLQHKPTPIQISLSITKSTYSFYRSKKEGVKASKQHSTNKTKPSRQARRHNLPFHFSEIRHKNGQTLLHLTKVHYPFPDQKHPNPNCSSK